MLDQYTDKKNRTYKVIHKNCHTSEQEEKQKEREQQIIWELIRILMKNYV